LNLATAVATVLWDRHYKQYLRGEFDPRTTPGAYEKRGVVETPADLLFGSTQ
jgi:hypothetical protein